MEDRLVRMDLGDRKRTGRLLTLRAGRDWRCRRRAAVDVRKRTDLADRIGSVGTDPRMIDGNRLEIAIFTAISDFRISKKVV